MRILGKSCVYSRLNLNLNAFLGTGNQSKSPLFKGEIVELFTLKKGYCDMYRKCYYLENLVFQLVYCCQRE